MLYQIIKLIVGLGIRLYYKTVSVSNKHFLDTNGPTIVIANHPNTLMDAWMIGHVCRQPIHFMAKGTLFNSRLKMKILRSLKMIPINRVGEQAIKGVSNHQSFEECYKILEAGNTLVIFPEGSSFQERLLRELKSGAARIALEVQKRGLSVQDVQVVPVGLNYTQAEKFRSKVFVHVGQPISATDFIEEYKINASKAAKKMTETFRVNLERLLVNSTNKTDELLVDRIARVVSSRYRGSQEPDGELQLLKKIRDRLDGIHLMEAWKVQEIQDLLDQIEWETKKLNVKVDFLDRKFRSRMFFRQLITSILFAGLAFPIFVYGLIHNFVQYKLTDFVIPKITKDIEYFAPMAVLLGLILYPVVYTIFMLTIGDFTYVFGWKVIYFFSMPFSGLFTLFFYKYMQHIGYKWKYIFLMFNKDETLISLKEKREELIKYFEL